MRTSREESIHRFLKLIDACKECLRMMRAEVTRQQFERFGFELETELRRLGGTYVPTPQQQPAADSETQLKNTVALYEDALTLSASAHARAMLTRQVQEIRKTSALWDQAA
jgi:hypothetical protein